jgi:hypothetical protein
MQLSICLVSPGHLGSNPRLVKEADTLMEAGYRVHVIYGETYVAAIPRDIAILSDATWTSEKISFFSNRARALLWRASQRLAFALFKKGVRKVEVLGRASHPLFAGLRDAALNYKADLYIGHCLPSLPVVVAAAERYGALCAFDAEDFHSGESNPCGSGQINNLLAENLESKFLCACDYLSTASPLIAANYELRYGVVPTTLLNVFPLREAANPEIAPVIPSFYWFSQTIGLGRGLEEMIGILNGLARPVRLHLRGHSSGQYRAALDELVQSSLIELRFFPPDAPSTMVPHAAGYTAGLALERREPLNRDICLTNKAFTFLLAGIPVIFSRTKAQEQLAADLKAAALLIDIDETDTSASVLSRWLDDSNQQSAAREHALRIGREFYHWDREKLKFLALVRDVTSRVPKRATD